MADRGRLLRSCGRVDDRGAAAVVGKVLEIGLVLLFVAAITTTLFGGAVPGYRTAAGDEVAERTLAAVSQRVQQAVPGNATHVHATASVDLPDTIRGRPYAVGVRNRTLVVNHPHAAVDATARLALPPAVTSVSGSWSSDRPARVVVRSVGDGLAVELVEGAP